MVSLLKLIRTSRPFIWPGHVTFFIYGALQSGSFEMISSRFLLAVLILTLPFSLYVYAVNDYYDLKTDLINPRKGGLFGEKHQGRSVEYLKVWGWTGLIVALLLSSFLGISAVMTLLILSLILYAYSAPPFRLKSVPAIDGISGGGLYAYILTVLGYISFGGNIYGFQTLFLPLFILFFLMGIVAQLMGTVLDVEPDQKENIRTSAVYFRPNQVVTFCLFILAICLILVRNNWLFFTFISCLAVVISFGYSRKWRKSDLMQKLGAVYLPTAFFLVTIFLYFIRPEFLRI